MWSMATSPAERGEGQKPTCGRIRCPMRRRVGGGELETRIRKTRDCSRRRGAIDSQATTSRRGRRRWVSSSRPAVR
mgnify:CR=1 FL=1